MSTLSPALFFAVLLAALLHAVWNALVKSRADRLLMLAAVTVVGSIFGAALVLTNAPPAPASWVYIAVSALLHTGYFFFLIRAYQVGDLSHVYPLARGLAPLLVTLGAWLFAGETLGMLALVGIALASCGIMSLAADAGAPWHVDKRPVLFAIATSVFIAAYTVVDGIGVRLSGNALAYIGWLFLANSWLLVGVTLHRRRGRVMRFVRDQWRVAVGGGVASVVAYGLVIYAMSSGAMAIVSALRETSVIFAALIGTLALGEGLRRGRVLAASVVAVGVALIHATP